MKHRQLGDLSVSAIGFGGMPLSIEGRPDEAQAVRTVHAALDSGVTLFDTANSYHLHADEVGHNELLLTKAIRSWSGDSADVLIATKGGHLRPGDGTWTQNAEPAYLKEAAKASLKRLGGDAIGLYYLHRPDPEKVPYVESVGAIRDLLDEGVIARAGISNVSPEQITIAQEILGGRLVAVQNRFSPSFRSTEPGIQLCQDMGVAFLPWWPLGGIKNAASVGGQFAEFQRVADAHHVSPQVVCLAWELAKSPCVIPIPGARRPASILDSATAPELELSGEEMKALDAALLEEVPAT